MDMEPVWGLGEGPLPVFHLGTCTGSVGSLCRDVQLRLESQVPPLLHQEACLQEADGSGQGTGASTEVSEDMSKINVYF